MRRNPNVHPRLALLALLAPILILSACGKKTTAPMASGDPPPVADSPRHAVDLFRWCWVHRDIAHYREVFTEDLVFTFAYRDTAGALIRDTLNREEVIDNAAAIFSIASSIRLDYLAIDPPEPDPRPGKDPGWHQVLRARFNLLIHTIQGSQVLSPAETFYLTRGDSAVIPAELVARGFGPDPNHWYISYWEDDTYVPPPVPGTAARVTWPPGAAIRAGGIELPRPPRTSLASKGALR